MRPLRLLGTALSLGLCSPLLTSCGSSEEPATTRGPNSGSSVTGTGQSGVGGASNGGTATGSGATASGSSATNAGNASGIGGSGAGGNAANNVTTGPFVDGGVGGSFVNTRDDGTPADACQGFEIGFTPQIPTVFILVDRSTSMWDNMYWDNLRDGVLQVVEQLHEDVRFGLGTFTGIQGMTCPLDLEDVGVIDFNNYQAISDFYTVIGHPGVATETPTPAGLQRAREILEADALVSPGYKFILLVTDGNPDYCDSGATECRADTTVRVLQDIHTAGIRTFVVAIRDPGIDQDWLTAFANAGAGQPVSAPRDTMFCDDVPAATAAVLPGVDPTAWPKGSYGATMGPEEPYQVDPADQQELVAQIGSVIAGVKSCEFDLTDANGAAIISIEEGKEAEGKVIIKTTQSPEGTEQPYDDTNGWRVNRSADGDQIELVGASCDTLRSPETTGIEFQFPCEIIIVIPK